MASGSQESLLTKDGRGRKIDRRCTAPSTAFDDPHDLRRAIHNIGLIYWSDEFGDRGRGSGVVIAHSEEWCPVLEMKIGVSFVLTAAHNVVHYESDCDKGSIEECTHTKVDHNPLMFVTSRNTGTSFGAEKISWHPAIHATFHPEYDETNPGAFDLAVVKVRSRPEPDSLTSQVDLSRIELLKLRGYNSQYTWPLTAKVIGHAEEPEDEVKSSMSCQRR